MINDAQTIMRNRLLVLLYRLTIALFARRLLLLITNEFSAMQSKLIGSRTVVYIRSNGQRRMFYIRQTQLLNRFSHSNSLYSILNTLNCWTLWKRIIVCVLFSVHCTSLVGIFSRSLRLAVEQKKAAVRNFCHLFMEQKTFSMDPLWFPFIWFGHRDRVGSNVLC